MSFTITRRISQAIVVGAPTYNAGGIQQCATVYRDMARDIASLLPSVLRTELLQKVAEGESKAAATNYNAMAWALR